MEVARDVQAESEREYPPLAELTEDPIRRIAVEEAEMLLQDLGEGLIGDRVSVGKAPAGAQERLESTLSEPLPELTDEACLPDSRFSHHGDEPRLASRDGVP